MSKKLKPTKGHEIGKIQDLRQLLDRAAEKYGDKIAFEYKKDATDKNSEIIVKTFNQFKKDAKKLSTIFLNMGLEGKRVAVIGNNSYSWCVTYMAVVSGDMVIVPLDKALPDTEIKSLIKRSKADAVVFDKKYVDVFEEIRKENKSNLQLKNEDEEADMYLFLVSELQKNGFKQYEISNFAKEGCESQHNLKYWNSQEYLGIGPSAHSFIDGKRFFYPRSIKDFLSGNLDAVEDGIGGAAEEYAMLKLRLCEGISNIEFKNRFGVNIPEAYLKRAKDFQKHGLTVVNDRGICFTPEGFLLSNELISRIIL